MSESENAATMIHLDLREDTKALHPVVIVFVGSVTRRIFYIFRNTFRSKIRSCARKAIPCYA